MVGIDRDGVAEALLVVRVPPARAQAHGGPHQWTVAEPVSPASGRTERAAVSDNDARVDRSQLRIAETEFAEGARLEVGQHHVAVLDQAQEQLTAAVGTQVETEAALVAVSPGRIRADRVVRLADAVRIGAAFDLD